MVDFDSAQLRPVPLNASQIGSHLVERNVLISGRGNGRPETLGPGRWKRLKKEEVGAPQQA